MSDINRFNKVRKKKKKSRRRKQRQQQIIVLAILVVAVLLVIYIAGVVMFHDRFLPKTEINGLKCGGKKIEQVEKLLSREVEGYTLTIRERNDVEETISGEDIGLELVLGTALDDYMDSQKPRGWFKALFSTERTEIQTGIGFDETKLQTALDQLSCMDAAQMYRSEDAHLSDYAEGKAFELVPAVYGTRVDRTEVTEYIEEAITRLDDTIDLEALECYTDPVYTEDSEEAKQMLQTANKLIKAEVTFTFGDDTEVVDGATIYQWMQIDDDLTVTIDEEKEQEFVEGLASKYDTKWKTKRLDTTNGGIVTIDSGNYGWRMDQESTLELLDDCIQNGKTYNGEAEYYQKAEVYDQSGYDYGHTYVEVSISEQHLWYYKNGALVLESDFVSGDVAKGYDTPTGAYAVAYKARDQVLTGQDYESPVSYWMPFVEGCGFHDASWRTEFGGTIYETNGSHGCLNLPEDKAEALYNSIEAGTAVLIYN